jgi:2-methylcitrate dehydratase PrpD
MGLAVAQAAGIRSSQGSMGSKIIGGQAARSGFMSAWLAARGFSNSESPIEGPKGFVAVLADPGNPAAVIDRLGEHFEILSLAYKPFPSGIVNHAPAEACIRLAQAHDLDAASVQGVQSVHLRVHPLTVQLCDRQQPAGREEGLVSAQHWAAAGLLFRRAGLQESREACVRDPAVAALRARVTLQADAGMGVDAATATVTLADGRRLEHHVAHCMGSLARPMSDADLDEKFRGQAGQVLPQAQVEALIGECWGLAGLKDVGGLAARHFQADKLQATEASDAAA